VPIRARADAAAWENLGAAILFIFKLLTNLELVGRSWSRVRVVENFFAGIWRILS
jgi:hypothetical protein